MANMTFKANLLPNSNLGYNLGSSSLKWNVYGDLKGNADTATKATQDGSGNTISTTYAKLASPTFTGTPKAPTAAAGTNTTQIATTAFVQSEITKGYPNAGYHNSIYRGKNLGSSVTATQYAEISAGTFNDLFIGDYWVINNINWRIAAFDYWLNTGVNVCSTHHVVIVPDSALTTCQMSRGHNTTGAYVGSSFYTGNDSNIGRATAQTIINNAFGSGHILTHDEYLPNAATDGHDSGVVYVSDSTFELMNEEMVFGGRVIKNVLDEKNFTFDNAQLPLFTLDHSKIICSNNLYWWLREVASSSCFAAVVGGSSYRLSAGWDQSGIRPAFGIKA